MRGAAQAACSAATDRSRTTSWAGSHGHSRADLHITCCGCSNKALQAVQCIVCHLLHLSRASVVLDVVMFVLTSVLSDCRPDQASHGEVQRDVAPQHAQQAAGAASGTAALAVMPPTDASPQPTLVVCAHGTLQVSASRKCRDAGRRWPLMCRAKLILPLPRFHHQRCPQRSDAIERRASPANLVCQSLHSSAMLHCGSRMSVVPAQAFGVGASAAEPAWQRRLDGWEGATYVQLAADHSGIFAAAILPKYAPWARTCGIWLGVLTRFFPR